MADTDTGFDPGAGDTSTETLLQMANRISNALKGHDASASLRPSKQMIIDRINDAYKEICGQSEHWTFMRYDSTIDTSAGNGTYSFPNTTAGILRIYSTAENLKEYPADKFDMLALTSDFPYGYFYITSYNTTGQPQVYIKFQSCPATTSYTVLLKPENLTLDDDTTRIPAEFRYLVRMRAYIMLLEEGHGRQEAKGVQNLYSAFAAGMKGLRTRYLPKMYEKVFYPILSNHDTNYGRE